MDRRKGTGAEEKRREAQKRGAEERRRGGRGRRIEGEKHRGGRGEAQRRKEKRSREIREWAIAATDLKEEEEGKGSLSRRISISAHKSTNEPVYLAN